MRTAQLGRLQVHVYTTYMHAHHMCTSLYACHCMTALQAACDLLRKVIRMLYLMKRVRAQMQAGVKEIAKVAQTFSEIGRACSMLHASDHCKIT